MIDFDILFESVSPDQQRQVQDLKERIIRVDFTKIHPNTLMSFVQELISIFNLKNSNQLSTILNPNCKFLDRDFVKLFMEMMTAVKSSYGDEVKLKLNELIYTS